MSKKWRTILIGSLIGNLLIVYVAYKALEYRQHINHFLEKYTQVVNEFSGRARYHEANLRLAEDQQAADRVVIFGTQVTENWPQEFFGNEFEIINRGISGQRVAGFLLRFKPDVLDVNPGAVIIEVSSYNFRPQSTVEEIKDYVVCMAELAELHDIEPILTTAIPLRAGTENIDGYSIIDTLAVYNNWLIRYTDSAGYALVNLNGLVADDSGHLRPELSSGGIDLNEQGYAVITQACTEVLRGLFNTEAGE